MQDAQWEVPYATPEARNSLNYKLMRSERWFPRSTTKVANRGLPYIDRGGHICGSSLMTWKSSSAQWFSTVCRSVFNKLKNRMSHDTKSYRKRRDFIAKVSVFYCITQDDSKLERIVRCHEHFAQGLYYKFVLQMDEQERFLFGQMLNSILWLQSRGKPRAKSIDELNHGFCKMVTSNKTRDISVVLQRLSDPWITGPLKLVQIPTR